MVSMSVIRQKVTVFYMNEFAITSQGIGDSLQRSASSLATARNSLEESIGLIVGANTVVQDTNKVGVALKTLSLRIMSTKAELEEMGEDAEYAAETISDYRNQILGLTSKTTAPVDLYDINGEYKNTTQILRELSSVWDQLTVNEQAAIEKLLAGARQANIFASIMTNFDVVEDAIEAASNATGSAMAEQEAWQDSIIAKQQKVAAIFQSVSSNILNSDDYKAVLDFVINLSEAIDKLTASGNGLKTLIPVISGIFGGAGGGFFSIQNLGKTKNLVAAYNSTIMQGAEAQRQFIAQMATSNPTFAAYLTSLNGAQASTRGFANAQRAATASTIALNAATVALNAVINAGIGLAITLIVTAISKWVNVNKELTQSLKDSSQQLENNTADFKSYQERVNQIIDSEKTEYDKINELNEIKDELNTKYRLEIQNIKDVTEARNILNDAIKQEAANERDVYLADKNNRKAYEQAKKALTDNSTEDIWGDQLRALRGMSANIGGFTLDINGLDNISEDIQKLFDTAQFVNYGMGDMALFSFDQDSFDNEMEYFDILEKKYLEFERIRATRVSGLTKDEEKLFNLVSDQYDYLKEKNADYITNVETYSKYRAEQLISLFDQNDLSRDEYFEKLAQYAEGDMFVISALKELIFVTETAKENVEELVSPLAEVIGSLQLIGNETSDMTVKINNANESFEKLEKVFQTNNDPDKFFNASEIIELLDLYPQLNDAILESQYGYKIEEEALENLRKAKLEEQKTALQAQLEETNTLMQATKEKLAAYSDELTSIKTVAQAKIELAELDAKLERARAENSTDPYKVSVQYLEGQQKAIQEYIDASEKAKKYEEQIKKLQVQINVLGQVHDSAKDKTQDHTKALQDQKNAIKDLSDQMKDAKKDIEDLIDLTMDMIKRQKENEKTGLKNQIEDMKKLVERRKELIDLEKQEIDFKNQLADKNKEINNIEQELAALSIEGANYSLEDQKRKAELEQKLLDKQKDQTEFLYDHEVDIRKDALDKESESFEEQLNSQIKVIDDYLDHEGKIREDAINLINGKSQQFYNDLLAYTMNYTKKSRAEFDDLWNSAYLAIERYANGQLNVDLALANLIAQMAVAEQQTKDLENAMNSLKNATSSYADTAIRDMAEYNKVLNETKANLAGITYDSPIGAGLPNSPMYEEVQDFMDKLKRKNAGSHTYWSEPNLRKYHDGGVVEGITNPHGEVLAKLLKGEVVATESQARNFMEHTLPKLAANSPVTNNSVAPVINIGDIVVNGNADSSTIDKLKAVRESIVNDVFKVVNQQANVFNGRTLRSV